MILNVNTKPLNSYGVPDFTYTGTYQIVDDNDNILTDMKAKNWKIRLLSSGDLTFTKLKGAKSGIDVFLVGGGGNGGTGYTYGSSGTCGGGGGGGGYTKTEFFKPSKTKYSIKIGGAGGNTTAFEFTAEKGSNGGNGTTSSGGAGGNGSGKGGKGGGRYTSSFNGGNGGIGVYEFNEPGSFLYGGGGGGSHGHYEAYDGEGWHSQYGTPGNGGLGGGGFGHGQNGNISGTANTGGGGGGAYGTSPGQGGSGIVVIRNARPQSWKGLFTGTVNASGSLNVRNIPSSTASGTKVNGKLAYQRQVAVYDLSLSQGTNETVIWAKINEKDVQGWASMQYIDCNAYGFINKTNGAVIYSSASINGTQVVTIPEKDKIFATNFVSGEGLIWAKVNYTIDNVNYTGYVQRDYITFPSSYM